MSGTVYEHAPPSLNHRTSRRTQLTTRGNGPRLNPFSSQPASQRDALHDCRSLDRRLKWVSRRRRIPPARGRCCCRPLRSKASRGSSHSRASWPDWRRSSTRRRSCGCFCKGEIKTVVFQRVMRANACSIPVCTW